MIIPREIRKALKAETRISENLGRQVSTAIDVKLRATERREGRQISRQICTVNRVGTRSDCGL